MSLILPQTDCFVSYNEYVAFKEEHKRAHPAKASLDQHGSKLDSPIQGSIKINKYK